MSEMYADFEYYQKEYGGKVFPSADDMKRYARKADRILDSSTSGKLEFAFPTDTKTVQAIKDCACELAEFSYQIDQYLAVAAEGAGYITQEDGKVRGKIVKSVSSGSESITYTGADNTVSTIVSQAAKDKKVRDVYEYGVIRGYLTGMKDANGVMLLYAGDYPGRRCVWASDT
ncbi:MAG: hypothetical protein IJO85_07495 [Lachnospiraceae bacterium]|nr:hypothetical protein [Lachnospiraceae bacterium]